MIYLILGKIIHEKVKNTDKVFYAIYTNPEYKLPTVLPDGKYKGKIPNIASYLQK